MKVKGKVGFKQYGKSLVILTEKEFKGETKFTTTIVDTDERKATVDKVKGLVAIINKTASEAQVTKKLTTLTNIFLKNRKEVETKEIVKKAKAKIIAKGNKKVVKSVTKKTSAIAVLTAQIENLPEKDKKALMVKLNKGREVAVVEKAKPKASTVPARTRRGEY